MATVDEESRRQYRDVAPFNPTSQDRAQNTQMFVIFLQKVSQVQPILRVLSTPLSRIVTTCLALSAR